MGIIIDGFHCLEYNSTYAEVDSKNLNDANEHVVEFGRITEEAEEMLHRTFSMLTTTSPNCE